MKKYIKKSIKENKAFKLETEKKVVILSDFHLGAGWANDDSLKNNLFMFEALKYYYKNDYVVILNGDTLDLAEEKDIKLIEAVHEDLFWLFGEIYKRGNLIYIKGNHDAYVKPSDFYNRILSYTKKEEPFMQGIELYDQVDFFTNNKHYCIMHGHQNNFWYRYLNRFVCFMVGLWGKISKWAGHDPTCALGNIEDNSKEIKEFVDVAEEENLIFVCGHTHSVSFDKKGYYNVGAGVLPRCITCGEIIDGEYQPYKWSYAVENEIVKVKKTKL